MKTSPEAPLKHLHLLAAALALVAAAPAYAIDECFVGGCSGEVCSDNPRAISACVWRPEFACFAMEGASCERQLDGACAWTLTGDARECRELAKAPEVQVATTPAQSLPFDVLAAPVVAGHLLKLKVGYGGGCAAHAFELVWDGTFLESNPMQVRLTLVHTTDQADACEMYATRELSLSLLPIDRAWGSGRPTSILLRVVGVSGSTPYAVGTR